MPVGKVCGEDLHSCSYIAAFSLCPHMVGRRDKGALWVLSSESTNLIHEGSSPMAESSPEVPATKYHHTGGEASAYGFGGHKHSISSHTVAH